MVDSSILDKHNKIDIVKELVIADLRDLSFIRSVHYINNLFI